jgi:hypothetical protein
MMIYRSFIASRMQPIIVLIGCVFVHQQRSGFIISFILLRCPTVSFGYLNGFDSIFQEPFLAGVLGKSSSLLPSLNASAESFIPLCAASMYVRNAEDMTTTCLRWYSVISGMVPLFLCLESYTASATAVWKAKADVLAKLQRRKVLSFYHFESLFRSTSTP